MCLDQLDVQAMATHTVYAGDLADELDKLKIPYILLLDSYYWAILALSSHPS